MGQRYIELATTYTINLDGSATLHVSQLPPNPAIFPPGPAMIHVVVNGIPSVGKLIMVGSGKIENQTCQAVTALPPDFVPVAIVSTTAGATPSANPHNSNGGTGNLHGSGAWPTISCLVALVAGAALLSA
jgi:Galactose oxidase-like, Early set domain